ncbi:hypothetical protein NT6N_24330 [Oceaniferula spumae]|uniref:Uncharacterized protein n=1 Tax=Oceaniferula spumae TaxID=2979115 RepID=A0AAT9FN65_9BACT
MKNLLAKMNWKTTVCVAVLFIGGFFLGQASRDGESTHNLGAIRTYDDGYISFVQHEHETGSQYNVYWHAKDRASAKLLDFSDPMPRVGRLPDGRIWLITFVGGDVRDCNLKVQRLEGGWTSQFHPSEVEALLALTRNLEVSKN